MFFMILRKPHILENSGSQDMARKLLANQMGSILKILYLKIHFTDFDYFLYGCINSLELNT